MYSTRVVKKGIKLRWKTANQTVTMNIIEALERKEDRLLAEADIDFATFETAVDRDRDIQQLQGKLNTAGMGANEQLKNRYIKKRKWGKGHGKDCSRRVICFSKPSMRILKGSRYDPRFKPATDELRQSSDKGGGYCRA
eukprot:GHVU01085423.1.p1 GENE.GHVU01085423.1~~GHVU01085423.1.p1  ORF type:complete len:139 (+),score=15.26 GHVU01085423.1:305-721(+)